MEGKGHAVWFGCLGVVLGTADKARETNPAFFPSFVFSLAFPPGVATNCHELFLRGETSSRVYTVQPVHGQAFDVYCEMTAEGGWTVIQKRQDGSVDFDQLWQAYQKGFGSLKGKTIPVFLN